MWLPRETYKRRSICCLRIQRTSCSWSWCTLWMSQDWQSLTQTRSWRINFRASRNNISIYTMIGCRLSSWENSSWGMTRPRHLKRRQRLSKRSGRRPTGTTTTPSLLTSRRLRRMLRRLKEVLLRTLLKKRILNWPAISLNSTLKTNLIAKPWWISLLGTTALIRFIL